MQLLALLLLGSELVRKPRPGATEHRPTPWMRIFYIREIDFIRIAGTLSFVSQALPAPRAVSQLPPAHCLDVPSRSVGLRRTTPSFWLALDPPPSDSPTSPSRADRCPLTPLRRLPRAWCVHVAPVMGRNALLQLPHELR